MNISQTQKCKIFNPLSAKYWAYTTWHENTSLLYRSCPKAKSQVSEIEKF